MKNSIPKPTKSSEVAIKVSGVSKSFRLPHEKQTSVKSLFINAFRRRTYEKQQALQDISFEVKKGEFFGIVGRNGSGKSTLLKMLAGIYTPDEGTIDVNGSLTPFIELGVGFNPELTGKENVFLNGALLGFDRREMEAMYQDIVAFAELERFMDQKLKNYSSGMQVRLAFSIAIRAESDILLIDEVLAVGDQSFQEKCYRYFSNLKKTNRTVVFVTHDMGSVERYCDKVLLLDKSLEKNGIYGVREAVAIYNRLNHDPQDVVNIKIKNKKITNKPFIRNVILLDSTGKETKSFEQGEPLRIMIEVANQNRNEKLVVGLSFHDKDNINLAGPNSLGTLSSKKPDKIEYSIASVPFNMGNYYVTVALFDEYAAQQYDILDKEISFFVNTKEVAYGKIVLGGTWRSL